jgi:hypothetical protein
MPVVRAAGIAAWYGIACVVYGLVYMLDGGIDGDGGAAAYASCIA